MHGDPELRAEYEKIAEQVRQTKESILQVAEAHFSTPVDELQGTIADAGAHGIHLKEDPGRTFHFSSVGSTMADLLHRTWSLPGAEYKTSCTRGTLTRGL